MPPAPLETRLPAAKAQLAKTTGWRGSVCALAIYVLIMACCAAYFSGDTTDYAESILTHREFWDFGHLLWRPTGWLAYEVCRPLFAHPGAYERANVTLVLLGLNWVAGASAVWLLCSLLTRVCAQAWAACVVTGFFICSQAFLNYTQTGNAYSLGLALLLLGLYWSVLSGERGDAAVWPSAASGLALAGAVCMWLPYALALPAALAAPYFVTDCGPTQQRQVLRALTAFALATVSVYGTVSLGLGLHNPAAMRAWIAAASHGIPPAPGVLRMAFGLARSFISLGNEGVLFKRFLTHDPFNPVSFAALLRASLWKLLLFYVFAATLVISLARAPGGRKILGLFALNALPVVLFATFWQGGDMERYLALYPTFFLAVAYLLGNTQKSQSLTSRWPQALALAFIVTTIATNLSVMAKPVLKRQEAATAARLTPLQPFLKPTSIIVVTHLQDELINFNRSYPFNPVNRNNHIRLRVLVALGTDTVPRWRQLFAARALATWSRGGDVWLSRRLLAPRPRAEWNWVEGDDKRVSWGDLFRFFAPFEKAQKIGGMDGFALLKPSVHNRQLLPVPAALDSKVANAPD